MSYNDRFYYFKADATSNTLNIAASSLLILYVYTFGDGLVHNKHVQGSFEFFMDLVWTVILNHLDNHIVTETIFKHFE